MSHPADSPSWKLLDDKWPKFGYKACPICGDDTPSHRLKNGHKICYIGDRKWLPINHPYKRQRVAFNGKPEYGTPHEPLTGKEVLHMVEDGDRVCWKKKSIFFDLEYWKYLPVRHVLDVMHIEKNVCDSIIGDVRIECEPFTRGMPNVDTFDELVCELGSQNIRDGCEDIWIE
ncbi:unnamed protein product [Prunus brigantina]